MRNRGKEKKKFYAIFGFKNTQETWHGLGSQMDNMIGLVCEEWIWFVLN